MFDKKLGEISICFTKIDDVDIPDNHTINIPEQMNFMKMWELLENVPKLFMDKNGIHLLSGGWNFEMLKSTIIVMIKDLHSYVAVFADNILSAIKCFDQFFPTPCAEDDEKKIYGILHSNDVVIDPVEVKASLKSLGIRTEDC